ncbi:MAG TPA: 4-hydroxythreonine-4-phosphate dehydrogenase PdxA [Spirochaetales bacterium]|nr:4-hydroxythreonine-4-phosphate dehydrogenase PdxA [Spirochaetales bacterium]HOV39349.1 4-hydroxythreonine-4-phosphate dehydrogenase PdxA [Spirochaetales bacterium]
MERPLLGITIGDPAGAGPEICIKALNKKEVSDMCRPVLYGDEKVLRRAIGIVPTRLSLLRIQSPLEYKDGFLNLISLDNMPDTWEYAKVQAPCGKAAFEFIVRAIEDAKAKKIAGVVTGPINKEAMNSAGIHYAGMTEIFADLTGAKDYAMMLTGGPLKVIHVSTHVSMKEAIERVKKDRVLRVIRLAQEAMRDLGIEKPRIAVAGLNAHAGENGLFGNEELNEVVPAIQEAKREGLDVTGPVPPDTVFLKAVNGMFDMVVVMYHDQGHIPLKLLDFMGGVNVTVGIPILRTSVDHGTVFGKAGKGTADESSMIKAIELAVQFARNRKE